MEVRMTFLGCIFDEAPEADGFFPTREDVAEVFADEWQQCDFCGEDYPVGSECDCNDGFAKEPSDDFPLYMEYEGAYGLAGYDDIYDSGSDW